MILVTIERTGQQSGDLRTADRIVRGINGLEASGYAVEHYTGISQASNEPFKRVIAIRRTEGANDTEFETWLNKLNGRGEQDV